MAQKGINSFIEDGKKELAKTISDLLNEGIPTSVLKMILESLLLEIDSINKEVIEKEVKEYEEKLAQEQGAEQVVYQEPIQAEVVENININ